ncbi:MAG: DUF3095 domain-containing protein [Alphaproteobacteria bacterium]|nr:DUF3095 domain-containing protein [Alphaproteobacteria bacterium]
MNPITVASFSDALVAGNYVRVPDDWFIAVGDVVQSTPAIAAGRYKDVNLAGAATIVGILNACNGQDLPFAFGGDGGIVLIPSAFEGAARTALQGVQKIGRNALSLDLRCALVPVAAVRAEGRDVRVAYQSLGSARKLAMISGGGIDCAEALAKSASGAQFVVSADEATLEADLNGLSCRWQPLMSRNGVMLSAIVRANDQTSPLPSIYLALYDQIQSVLTRDACPVSLSNLKPNWPPRGAKLERAFGRSLFEVYGQSLLAIVSERTGMTIGGFNGRAYNAAHPSHSDYRKFADSLRMVIDCSKYEADGIETILKAARAKNLIEFGLHRATSALMTCFVKTTDDGGHVHFIDGADGGYAMASQELKSQGSSNVGASA